MYVSWKGGGGGGFFVSHQLYANILIRKLELLSSVFVTLSNKNNIKMFALNTYIDPFLVDREDG